MLEENVVDDIVECLCGFDCLLEVMFLLYLWCGVLFIDLVVGVYKVEVCVVYGDGFIVIVSIIYCL